jgi:hypothetical protein
MSDLRSKGLLGLVVRRHPDSMDTYGGAEEWEPDYMKGLSNLFKDDNYLPAPGVGSPNSILTEIIAREIDVLITVQKSINDSLEDVDATSNKP